MPNQPKIQDNFTTRTVSQQWLNAIADKRPYIFKGSTTDATETELFVDGVSGQRIGVAQDSSAFVVAMFSAHNSTDAAENCGGIISQLVYNESGTTAALTQDETALLNDGTPLASLDVEADNTNDAIAIKVTGTAAKTIYYQVTVFVISATSPEIVVAHET